MSGSRRYSQPQGFTLLETVAALGMFVIVVLTVVNVYLTYARAQRLGSQRQKIITEANLLMDQMAREIRILELSYWGTFNYSNDATPETLYRVDVNAAEAGNPYANTNIYRQEHELVLSNNGGDETNNNDTVVAYVFNRRDPSTVLDLCADDDGDPLFPGTLGLYRFTRAGAAATVCERLFNIPGLNVVDAGFFYTQPLQPYPDDVDPSTDIQTTRDADCGPGTGANYNGSICTCTAANRTTACFSSTCSTTTGGQCGFGPNVQPAATFFLTVQDANNPGTRLTFQSTIVQRLYKR